jgi:hypothetical protein
METTYTRVHWVKIYAAEKQGQCDNKIVLLWQQLPFELRTKYDWYFKYRAALLQVQYPRWYVTMTFGSEAPNMTNEEHLRKNRLSSLRGQLTKTVNTIDDTLTIINKLATEDEALMFSALKSNTQYIMANNRLCALNEKKAKLELEITNLESNK